MAWQRMDASQKDASLYAKPAWKIHCIYGNLLENACGHSRPSNLSLAWKTTGKQGKLPQCNWTSCHFRIRETSTHVQSVTRVIVTKTLRASTFLNNMKRSIYHIRKRQNPIRVPYVSLQSFHCRALSRLSRLFIREINCYEVLILIPSYLMNVINVNLVWLYYNPATTPGIDGFFV